jgi:DNA-binding NtrC family response regulator
MNRVLILDSESPSRSQLVEAIQRRANTEVVLVANEDELTSRVKFGAYAAVFADSDLLDGRTSHLIAAVRSAIVRPMLVISSNEKAEDLDPDLVTLVVRKPYDVKTLTGILLSAIVQVPRVGDATTDTTAVC